MLLQRGLMLSLIYLAVSCSSEVVEEGAGISLKASQKSSGEGAHRYDCAVWHDDFPHKPHFPPPAALGAWYDRNRQQALEKVIANVQGNCSKLAWRFTREFFLRHREESRALLIEAMDAALSRHDHSEHAQNLVQVMGRAKDSYFADALGRAFFGGQAGLRSEALKGMLGSGSAKVLRRVRENFFTLDKLEQIAWVKAAAVHYPDNALVDLCDQMLMQTQFQGLQEVIIDSCMAMEPKRASKALEKSWPRMSGDLKLHIAGIFHAAGDDRGTLQIRHALQTGNLVTKVVAANAAKKGKVEPLLDELLGLTVENDLALNLVVIESIGKADDSRVEDTLLAFTDESYGEKVNHSALHALAQRGYHQELDRLVKVLATATGSTQDNALRALVSSGYEKAVPTIMARLDNAIPRRRVFYLKYVSQMNNSQAAQAMWNIFLQPEAPLVAGDRHTNVTFMSVYLANMNACAAELLELGRSLPKSDYRRRATWLHVMANMAGPDPTAPGMADVYDELRKIALDSQEIPQLRMLSIDYLKKDIRLDDVMQLKRLMRKEKSCVRAYINDFLTEFF